MSALILCALAREAQALSGRALPPGHLACVSPHLAVAVTGPGAAQVHRHVEGLVAQACDALVSPLRTVVSCGVAGAVAPQRRCGEVLVSSIVLCAAAPDDSAPTASAAADTVVADLAARLRSARLAVIEGARLAGSADVVASPEAKAAVHARLGADAIDMESAPIADAAARLGTTFLAVRVVADEAVHGIPPVVLAAVDADGEPDLRRLLAGLLRHPAQLPALITLARTWGRARRSLERCRPVLEAWAGDAPYGSLAA